MHPRFVFHPKTSLVWLLFWLFLTSVPAFATPIDQYCLDRQESVTEVVLQRYGMKSVPDRGILLKPLRLEKMITLLLDYNQLQELPDFLGTRYIRG